MKLRQNKLAFVEMVVSLGKSGLSILISYITSHDQCI